MDRNVAPAAQPDAHRFAAQAVMHHRVAYPERTISIMPRTQAPLRVDVIDEDLVVERSYGVESVGRDQTPRRDQEVGRHAFAGTFRLTTNGPELDPPEAHEV